MRGCSSGVSAKVSTRALLIKGDEKGVTGSTEDMQLLCYVAVSGCQCFVVRMKVGANS